jgi:6-phosphogluconolactonase/glucosamine-6-phosphate isomerase/deaminase
MEVIIKPDADAVSKEAARFFERQIDAKPPSVLGFAASDALLPLYRELVVRNEAEPPARGLPSLGVQNQKPEWQRI